MNRQRRLDFKRLDSDPGTAMFRGRVSDWHLAYTIDKQIIGPRIILRSEGYGWVADLH